MAIGKTFGLGLQSGLALLLLLAAAACDPAEDAAISATAPAPAEEPSPPLAALDGQWRVTAIDGRKTGCIELWSDGKSLWWEPGCAGQGRRFSSDGARFKTAPPAPVREVCDIGFPDDLAAVWARLDSADHLTMHGADSVRIGKGTAAVELQRVPGPATLAGEWRVAGIDGASFDEPVGLALSADGREVWSNPRCAGLVRRYTIDGRNFRAGPQPSSGPPPSPGTPPPPVCAIGLPPHLVDAMRAIDSATQIRRTPSNGIELSGGGHSLLLFAQ